MDKKELNPREAELNKKKDALPEDQQKYLFLGMGLCDTMLIGSELAEGVTVEIWEKFQAKVYALLEVAISFMNKEACDLLTFYSKTGIEANKPEEAKGASQDER